MAGKPVVVLGAGVIGLSTAITLQQAGYTVDIWAKDLPPYTTSNKVGATWRNVPQDPVVPVVVPVHRRLPTGTVVGTVGGQGAICPNTVFPLILGRFPFHVYPAHKVDKWAAYTLEYYKQHMLPDPSSGAMVSKYLQLSVEDKADTTPPPDMAAVEFWPAPPEDVPAPYRSGLYMSTVVINVDMAMAYLVQKFQRQGGRLTQRAVQHVNEAFAWYDVVVNCTGLGSRELFNDTQLFAARGQVVIARAKDNMTTIVNDRDGPNQIAYFVPRQMDIILGGTFQEGNESLLISEKDTEDILRRIEGMMGPRAARDNLEILSERVGLRPCRPEVRLEPEVFANGSKVVFHNYGHDGRVPSRIGALGIASF